MLRMYTVTFEIVSFRNFGSFAKKSTENTKIATHWSHLAVSIYLSATIYYNFYDILLSTSQKCLPKLAKNVKLSYFCLISCFCIAMATIFVIIFALKGDI